MSTYVALDCGTTKTKISLVSDGEVRHSLKIASSSDTARYKAALKEGISELLSACSLTEGDVLSILATGTMATAEFGICPLEHIKLPAGCDRLRSEAVETSIPEISGIPFTVVRGVKTACTSADCADMMRGEESEIMGLYREGEGECIYMLMGSHTKVVRVDADGRIADIATMLTGELASAVVKETILKHSVSLDGSVLDKKALSDGYEYAAANSLSEALFKVRTLRTVFGCTDSEAYSFFIGAILSAEVGYVVRTGAKRVVVGGNRYLKDAVAELLVRHTSAEVIRLSEEQVECAVSLGLVRIFEYGT